MRLAAAASVLLLSVLGCVSSSSVVVPGADPARGKQAISSYGCGACHDIPGVPGARGAVGPPLTGFGKRTIVAGRLANTPDNLSRWIQEPQTIEPGNAMPDLGVSNAEARDIAAYLLSLK